MLTASQSISRTLRILDAGLLEYHSAWNLQRQIFNEVANGSFSDTLILLEHPHTYTLGKTADRSNLTANEQYLRENKISVVDIDRGGDITYHGPGQLVGYPIIDLKKWKMDSHKYLRALEEVLIRFCEEFSLNAGRIDGLTGVWIDQKKIAAIGIKISRWVTMHGFALNIYPDLNYFGGIIPCGIKDKEVTSLEKETAIIHEMKPFKEKIVKIFSGVFEYDSFDTSDTLINTELEIKEAT
ncbi:MAG: lipoyl(octanoyl) transferase LipB [Ignavibacteriaceae bacterium]|nr:lipoyl(octanoyl) transferase LipB [Ignavibacteriaceae bacterium]